MTGHLIKNGTRTHIRTIAALQFAAECSRIQAEDCREVSCFPLRRIVAFFEQPLLVILSQRPPDG